MQKYKLLILWSTQNTFLINQERVYKNIWKLRTGQGDDYTRLLDYNYFNKHYKMIAIDLSKQQALDSDPKAIQQITFTGSQSGNNNKLMFFIIEEAKETTLDFRRNC